MLGLVDSQRSVLIFLGVATLIALGALLAPGTVWLLDVLTGIVAAAAAFMAGTRLALGTPNAAARRAWQTALVLFGLVCVGQLAAAFSHLTISVAAGGLLLAAALVLLWLIAKADPDAGGRATRALVGLCSSGGGSGRLCQLAGGSSRRISCR